MKRFFFPGWWDIQNGRLSRTGTDFCSITQKYMAGGRALFGDIGRLGCIAVTEELQTYTQFNKEIPFIYDDGPFYYWKNEASLNEENYKNPDHFISERKDNLNTLNYVKYNLQRIRIPMRKKFKKEMEKTINFARNDELTLENFSQIPDFVPPFLQYVVSERPELLSTECTEVTSKLSSPMYSGGCIKVIKFDNDTFVIHCDGPRLSKLSIKRFYQENNLLEKTSIDKVNINDDDLPIFQVDVANFNDFYNILIRSATSIVQLRLFYREMQLVIERVFKLNSMEQFRSCKQNLILKDDIFVSNDNKLIVYDSERVINVWQKDLLNYSTVIDCWNEIQSCLIPNSILVTNRSNSHLYDYRENPFKTGLEVFNSCVEFLSSIESLYHASSIINNYHCYLFSTFNTILIDFRSPQIPVSQWTTPMMGPPSYSSITVSANTNNVNVAVGCQLDARHFVFQQDFGSGHSKSRSTSSKPILENESIMSLGLELVVNDDKNFTTVLTLDHKGNIIGQRYTSEGCYTNYQKINSQNPTNSKIYPSAKRFKSTGIFFTAGGSLNFGNHYKTANQVDSAEDFDLIENLFGITDKENKKFEL